MTTPGGKEDQAEMPTDPLDDAIGGWLRDAVALEVEARDGQWPSFTSAVMAEITQQVEAAADESSPALALRATVAAEIATRDGEWSAFAASVARRIEDTRRADARQPADIREIASYRADVDAAVDAVQPRFEHELVDSVERRIGDLAHQPGLLGRLRAAFSLQVDRLTAPAGWAFGGIGTAMVAALMLFLAPGTTRNVEQVVSPGAFVTVDDVSFEGMVTVIEHGGMAVIWVADAAS